jgi:hypothetical protein
VDVQIVEIRRAGAQDRSALQHRVGSFAVEAMEELCGADHRMRATSAVVRGANDRTMSSFSTLAKPPRRERRSRTEPRRSARKTRLG